MVARVLVIESDKDRSAKIVVAVHLRPDGHRVESTGVSTIEQASAMLPAAWHLFDAVVIGESAAENEIVAFCRRLRQRQDKVPIFYVGHTTAPLEAGADMQVPSSFESRTLGMLIATMERRADSYRFSPRQE